MRYHFPVILENIIGETRTRDCHTTININHDYPIKTIQINKLFKNKSFTLDSDLFSCLRETVEIYAFCSAFEKKFKCFEHNSRKRIVQLKAYFSDISKNCFIFHYFFGFSETWVGYNYV